MESEGLGVHELSTRCSNSVQSTNHIDVASRAQIVIGPDQRSNSERAPHQPGVEGVGSCPLLGEVA